MVDTRIAIGLVAVIIGMVVMAWLGINERDRMATFEESQAARAIQTGGVLFETNCAPCHNTDGTGVPGRGPAVSSEHFFTNRLAETGYQGTLHSYVNLTVAGGRPVRTSTDYASPMPTWSNRFGGPFRDDQVRDVTAFVMNWDPSSAAPEVSQGLVEAADPFTRGQNLFNANACSACHTAGTHASGVVGPNLTATYADQGADFIREAIVDPNAVIAEGFTEGVMPPTFGDTLNDQQLDDIIIFLQGVSEGK